MKKFLLLCLALAVAFSAVGCTLNDTSDTTTINVLSPSGESFDSLISWVNYTGESDIFTNCLNAEKMAISSVQHLPIYKCASPEELADFKEQFKDTLSLSSGHDEMPSFEEITADLEADFFASNTLFLVYVSANNGSVRFDLSDFAIEENTLCAYISQTDATQSATQDMAGWMIIFPVSNDRLNDVISYDAIMNVE